jgi:hypothetical protein
MREEYEDIEINFNFDNPMDEAMHIIQVNENNLIIKYSHQGIIMFTKNWFMWYNHLHTEAFEFMSKFKPPQFDYNKPQIVYVCSIPEEHHIEFLNVIKKEYGM